MTAGTGTLPTIHVDEPASDDDDDDDDDDDGGDGDGGDGEGPSVVDSGMQMFLIDISCYYLHTSYASVSVSVGLSVCQLSARQLTG